MCGLTGVYIESPSKNQSLKAIRYFEKLALNSEERGKDSSGVYFLLRNNNDQNIESLVIKADAGIKFLISSNQYIKIANQIKDGFYDLLLVLSHTRMATVGDTTEFKENQPLVDNGKIIFFNGIVTNTINNIKNLYNDSNENDGWIYSDKEFSSIGNDFGVANLIRFNEKTGLLELYTNNGDLFLLKNSNGLNLFTSDSRFFQRIFGHDTNFIPFQKYVTYFYRTKSVDISNNINIITGQKPVRNQKISKINKSIYSEIIEKISLKTNTISRCKLCGSPEINTTVNICIKCNNYKPKKLLGEDTFVTIINSLKEKGTPVLLGFSGGRDSTFVLSELVETWKLPNIITYTFDWGLNTPYARYNVSRLSSLYGVRNILVAADIRIKRRNVNSVVVAYCKKPIVGLVPLLMAGDKQFISTAKKISNELNSDVEFFGFNPFEKTKFKEELIAVGLWPDNDEGLFGEDLSITGQYKLLIGYAKVILKNPNYWGLSLFDAAKGFFNYYHSGVIKTNYFDYFQWNESVVDKRLELIGWRKPIERSSWRIGDGTSAFYNLAYLLHQGWCENDVLRANQVRCGQLSLNDSLDKLYNDNIPDIEMLEWYFSILDLDPNIHLKSLLSNY